MLAADHDHVAATQASEKQHVQPHPLGNRPNHLTLVEVWRGNSDLEKHELAAHTRKFRDLLLPMSGSLYDQRLYQAIN